MLYYRGWGYSAIIQNQSFVVEVIMKNSVKRECIYFAYKYGVATLPSEETRYARSWNSFLHKYEYDKEFALMFYDGHLHIVHMRKFHELEVCTNG